MKVSLFFTNYGYHLGMGIQLHQHTKMEAADDFMSQMKHIHEEAQAAMIKA